MRILLAIGGFGCISSVNFIFVGLSINSFSIRTFRLFHNLINDQPDSTSIDDDSDANSVENLLIFFNYLDNLIPTIQNCQASDGTALTAIHVDVNIRPIRINSTDSEISWTWSQTFHLRIIGDKFFKRFA